ncbi:endo-beta-1,4-glucanase [Epithele typhae]|uniref:endo-beta-1,4-glucanase n=1 Tax=Epithele typhae TaxID=378194 RepID=UPI002007A877|nr:endo-beta-1,4-glucanase [Epithele typhae]KAH9935137.1 endo-beta-1,4-glucanase [Epithele typhae]
MPISIYASVHKSTCDIPGTDVGGGLNRAAEAAGKLYFGTATNSEQWNDTTYFDILRSSEFGQITAANVMKWFATEPSPGHNCVWHSQLPDWVANGTFTPEELAFVVERHCSTLVRHYRGHVWDVINEPFNDDGTFRSDVFFDTLNTTYIPIALHAARARIRTRSSTSMTSISRVLATALKNLVKTLQKEHVPIDGVGIQSHLIVGQVPDTFLQNLQEFTALGIEVALTELDIRFEALPPTAEGVAQQKKDYETVIAACKAVKSASGSRVRAQYSWIPGTFAGQGSACPWDENFVRKSAYFGIIDAFGA